MRVVVFNVRYSPNLGDGILAECLERELAKALPGAEVETVDLAGRDAYGAADSRRFGVLRLLGAMPGPVRRMVVERVLGSRLVALRPVWKRRIENADFVVIGGGNLFQDDDLNFPLKVGQVLDLCRETDTPVGVFAVGVSSHWSPRAAALFGRLRECRVFHASVRDAGALQNWQAHFSDWRDANLAPDPALTVEGAEHAHGHVRRVRPLVGLCVTHPVVLHRHASGGTHAIPLASVASYRALSGQLLNAGCDVVLFTNGALEDQAFLERVRLDLPETDGRMTGRCGVVARPSSPDELIALIGSLDGLVAHRLHACITAYALGIPAVGLGWDQKVKGFFRLTAREPFFVSAHQEDEAAIAKRVLAALEQGIDPETHRLCVAGARGAILRLTRDMKMPAPAADRASA